MEPAACHNPFLSLSLSHTHIHIVETDRRPFVRRLGTATATSSRCASHVLVNRLEPPALGTAEGVSKHSVDTITIAFRVGFLFFLAANKRNLKWMLIFFSVGTE